ncbi:hypothetical protein H0W32_00620, partial [Patescibacteria group bacterium]|nr:hypothetical protein [Patescibacteria group bacterium]
MSQTQTKKDYTSMPDIRNQVPHVIPFLQPGDKVIVVEHHPKAEPDALPDSDVMWCQFCRVDSLDKIGQAGPPIASGYIPGFQENPNQGKYMAPYNRDSWYMTTDASEENPQLVAVANRYANEHLGLKDVVHSECQFGRDYHEYRDPETDELAQQLTRERNWKWEPNGGFYAQVDCGALRLRSIHWCCTHLSQGFNYLDETYKGIDGTIYSNLASVLHRLRWIERKTSSNALGFIGYRAAFDGSPTTQEMQ